MPLQILVSTRKGLFTFTRRGQGSWRTRAPDFLAVPVSMALRDPRDGVVYAGLDHGHFGVKLHRRVGRTWQEITAPVYPQLPKGRVEKEGGGRPWPRTLKLVWSLEVDPRTPGALWCGTIPGGLFHTKDRGDTWQFNAPLWAQKGRKKWFGGGYDTPGIHSICVDPRDPAVVTIGISCGGVWQTPDGGRSWSNIAHGMRADFMPKQHAGDVDIQDPHRVVQCAAAPDRFWSQHHCGIYRTIGRSEVGSAGSAAGGAAARKAKRAGGRVARQTVARQAAAKRTAGRGVAGTLRWREVRARAPSRFGFACAVHPDDPDTAWFVPAVKDECRVPRDGRLVVTRTTDGGKTLDVLAGGLPRRDAFDLVYRHGLDVAADGRTLAMGSTTGNLWVSEDGGRRWGEVAAHLPPIFAVRFAPD